MRSLHGCGSTYAETSSDPFQASTVLLALVVARYCEPVQVVSEGAFTALHLIPACRVIDDLSRPLKPKEMKMRVPKLKTHGVVCGSVTTAIVTLAVAADWLPAAWNGAAESAALTGLLATLAAAFGLCDQYEDRVADLEARKDDEK